MIKLGAKLRESINLKKEYEENWLFRAMVVNSDYSF